MNHIKIGKFLRELRKEKGLTQEQLLDKYKEALSTSPLKMVTVLF